MLVLPPVDSYKLRNPDDLLTPALLIYPEVVDANVTATLKLIGGDPERWRPHTKTAKIASVIRLMIGRGIHNFKCSTTLELLVGCQAGAPDVLLAYPVMGANAARVLDIANEFPDTRISVLIESRQQAEPWAGSAVDAFIDINSGMNRTGIDANRTREIIGLAQHLGDQFRGLHFYDGHMAGIPADDRERAAHAGYDRLLELIDTLERKNLNVAEVITSGTPAAPFAMSYEPFAGPSFIHRISPGTVVYNDLTSLEQLPQYGYAPAALVLSTVVSHPSTNTITCDAGHKSVSADAGVPTCALLDHPDLQPGKPSEEHLPITGSHLPALGEHLYLLPRHVCPTVNNFDYAAMVVDGEIKRTEPVSARGHESLSPKHVVR
ncbi:MAG: alanine racemase [Acidobacteriaceae bacterium]|nr:alanine racemase [Acidobacteriaceae bacterium]